MNESAVLFRSKGPKTSVIQWSAKVIDIGVHFCVERASKGRKKHQFWYAYDLTSYHVATGPTPTKAIENLLHILWGGEVLSTEFRKKGERIIRNRLHREHPEAIRDMKQALKEWKGYVIQRVEWRKWRSPVA